MGPGSEGWKGGLTVAVLKQRGRVVEAAEGRAALRHRPATATAGTPGPSPGPVPTPGPASRCHSNTLLSSIPGAARPASGGRRRAWHRGHPSGCPEGGVSGHPLPSPPNTILTPGLVGSRSPTPGTVWSSPQPAHILSRPPLVCSGPMRACRAGPSTNRNTEGLEGAGPSLLFSHRLSPDSKRKTGWRKTLPWPPNPLPNLLLDFPKAPFARLEPDSGILHPPRCPLAAPWNSHSSPVLRALVY